MGGWKDCHDLYRVESSTCRCVNWVLFPLPPQNPSPSSPPVSLQGVDNPVHFPYTLICAAPADFDYLRVVDVTVDAHDLAGNSMDQGAYSFTTWEEPDTPYDMIGDLRHDVDAKELPEGTENSLTASLDVAVKILPDSDPDNYVAAINVLGAFIHKVEQQRDKKIACEVGDGFIARAREIIVRLSAGDMVP